VSETTQSMAPDPGHSDDEAWRGEIGKLGSADLDLFLGGSLICRLGCLTPDGAPYVVPCWFEWTGREFYIVPRRKSAWARYIQRDGRVCLSIDEDAPPYRKVMVEGIGAIAEEPNVGGQWVEIARRMSLRYLGEHGPDYLEPTLNQARWLIRVTPHKMTTWQGVAWHPRYFETGAHSTP